MITAAAAMVHRFGSRSGIDGPSGTRRFYPMSREETMTNSLQQIAIAVNSASERQPLRQQVRQSGLKNFFLCSRDIVGHAMESHLPLFGLPNGVGGAGIPIAR